MASFSPPRRTGFAPQVNVEGNQVSGAFPNEFASLAGTRQQLEQQLVAAHRTGNVQAAQQAAYAIRQYDQNSLYAQVPSINAPPPIDRVPKPTFGDWLENVSYGWGKEYANQIQGLTDSVQRGVSAFAKDPLKASAAAFMSALEPARQGFTQPVQTVKDVGTGLVETGKQMYQQATSGPVGLGQTLGQLIDMPGPDLPGGKRRPTMAELDVYHGTPHTFEPETGAPLGRFRSQKIGTGEGVQAYGYGLYFAGKESIARHYKDKLAGSGYTYDGVRYDQLPSVVDSPARGFSEKFMVAVKEGATPQEAIERIRRDARETLEITKRHLKEVEDNFGKTVDGGEGWGDLRHFTYDQSILDTQRKSYERALRDVEIADNLKPDTIKKLEGRLYKIDLPDQKIEQMLDWDSPVPEDVRKKVSSVMLERFGSGATGTSGEHLYREISTAFRRAGSKTPDVDASEFLRQQGVTGIKFLDAGSRADASEAFWGLNKNQDNVKRLEAQYAANPSDAAASRLEDARQELKSAQRRVDELSRNYVVFPGEEQHLTILERDGVKAEVPKPDELAYHGTTKQAAVAIEREGFDLTRAADGTVWFTSNPNIGEVAATGKGGIVARSVSGLKLGGWDEMDKYSTDELIAKGYDGLRLKDGDEITYQIFNPEKLKVPTKKAK